MYSWQAARILLAMSQGRSRVHATTARPIPHHLEAGLSVPVFSTCESSIDWIVKTTCLWSCHSTHILICDILSTACLLSWQWPQITNLQPKRFSPVLDLHSLYGLTLLIHQGYRQEMWLFPSSLISVRLANADLCWKHSRPPKGKTMSLIPPLYPRVWHIPVLKNI